MRFLTIATLATALATPSLACIKNKIYCYDNLNESDRTSADLVAFPGDFRYLCLNSEGTFGFKGGERPRTVEIVDRCQFGCTQRLFIDDVCTARADPEKDIKGRKGFVENQEFDMSRGASLQKDKTVDHDRKQWKNFKR